MYPRGELFFFKTAFTDAFTFFNLFSIRHEAKPKKRRRKNCLVIILEFKTKCGKKPFFSLPKLELE